MLSCISEVDEAMINNNQLPTNIIFFLIHPFEEINNAEYPLYVPVYKTEQ